MTRTFLDRQLEDLIAKHTSAELPYLAALARETNRKRGDSVMLSGHVQGAFLQMVSHMIRPRRILEIGTYTGYSALCLAQGLTADGHLHTIEVDEELQDMASRYIAEASLRDKITQHIGEAATIIPTLEEQFDMVFIDADKNNYSLYYDLVFPKVPVGGYILADNVLYNGEVILPANEQSKNARAIIAFNEKVTTDPRIVHVLLSLRDGMTIARKISE